MKLFWHQLSSWWFATMTPVYSPVTTIEARETLRKRRLFSNILLITFLVGLLFSLEYLPSNAMFIQRVSSVIGSCIPLFALWINQRGYLKWASVFYFFFMFLIIFMSTVYITLTMPVLALYFWSMLLILPVCSALFLPAWGPILLSIIEIAFTYWFVQYKGRSQIALFIPDPSSRIQFLSFICILISLAAIFSAIYAITTKKAVIQADRAVELEQAYALLEAAHATIKIQASTDGLTELPNHGAIVEQIEAELQICQTSQRNCVIIFVDVDHFKHINDTWGHAAGDTALRTVGQRLRAGIRANDSIGRYGGEEFAILLSDIEQAEALDLAERLHSSIASAPCLWLQEDTQSVTHIPLTASFGLASYPLDGITASELLDTADVAMYTAKHSGRNRICLPGDEVDTALLKTDRNQSDEQSLLQMISTIAASHNQDTQAYANQLADGPYNDRKADQEALPGRR